MKAILTASAAIAVGCAFAGTGLAQDHSAHSTAAAVELPAACQTAEAPEMPSMENMQPMMEGMGEHQKAMMQGMMATEGPMMQAMMAEDPDVAFACAMIPHHQGAITMAEAELRYGDSDVMKQLAQKIIDDQKREIEQLTQWITEQSQ